jgi:glycosyltransferase involved in cell wall biosynthesis
LGIPITVCIPSYNERKGIAKLLPLIQSQLKDSNFDLLEIIIYDNSDDDTPVIIEEVGKSLPIKLIHESRRQGVFYAFKFLMNHVRTEYFVYSNADAIPGDDSIKKLLRPLSDNQIVGITTPRMIPYLKRRSLTARASVFGAELLHLLRKHRKKWLFHGRIFAGRTECIKGIIPKMPIEISEFDSLIQFACEETGHKVVYVDDAKCIYIPPDTMEDFIIEDYKFKEGQQALQQYYPEYRERYRYFTKNSLQDYRLFFDLSSQMPSQALTWTLHIATLNVFFPYFRKKLNTRGFAKSTKDWD